jgi:cobalt-zinc-cadmium efflux system outer membrane protein
MRDRVRYLVLGGITLLLGTPAALAQRPLSLADAQAEARARAPEAAELQARIAGAEGIAAQAGRVFRDDPTITSSLFRGSVIGHPDESAWDIGVRQAFDLSGSWKPRAASATADVTRTRFEQQDALRALDERVAVAVADVALTQRQVTRTERIVELQRIAADAVRRQFEVGTAPQIDADSAALDLAASLMTLEQMRGDLDRSRVRLARLLGRETAAGLMVEDVPEPADVPAAPDFVALVSQDPRVQGATADVDAARFEDQTFERLVIPPVTFGVDYGRQRTDIPLGAFSGVPVAGGLKANWNDADLAFSVGVPIPLFNRQREPRARATARILAAEARLRAVRADVWSELETTWAALRAAARAFESVAPTSTIVDRDAMFVEQAVRAGQFDAITRSLALRRLEEAGRRIDTAVRDFRAARAAWLRRTQGLP